MSLTYASRSDLLATDHKPLTTAMTLPELLEKRLDCLRRLHYAAERQRYLVDVENIDAILGHLAQKQHLIDALLATERELDPHRGVAPEERAWASPEERERCQAVIAEGDTLLHAIIALDEESASTMMRQHKDLEGQIQRLGRGTAAAVAYSVQNVVSTSRETQTVIDLTH
ncbi:MAG: hypothetical protein ACRC46_10825 [Thermoguttaceae bacterium]